jgi:hypothetical protein
MRTPLAFAVSTSLALTCAASASAETVDAATKATARQLGEEGMKAFDKGDCTTAVDRLTKAHELVHVPTLSFYAGKCYEKLGRLVDAEEQYHQATLDTIDRAAPPAVKAAAADADKARQALLPRLPSVVIAIQPPLPDAQVTLDGKVLPPAMLGVKRFVDPGAHTVQVQRYGGVTSRQFSVQEGESTAVTLDVPAAGAIPPPPGYVVGAPAYGAPAYGAPVYYAPGMAGPPAVPMKRKNVGLFVAGCVVAPLGAVMALAGGVMIVNESNSASFNSNGTLSSSSSSTAPGLAVVAVGLVAMGGGIAMAVIGGKKVPVETAPPPPLSFEPLLGPGTAGMRMRF